MIIIKFVGTFLKHRELFSEKNLTIWVKLQK